MTGSSHVRWAASATRSVASSTASALLSQGGSAIDAVLGGFFAAAGEERSVLLGSLVALVAGLGAGARWFDGRPVQPGHGRPRPRGFRVSDEIPQAALAGIPRTISAATLLHGHRGRLSLSEVVKPGAAIARTSGAKARAELIKQVGGAGAEVLRRSGFVDAVDEAAGAVAGGLVGPDDFRTALPGEGDAVVDQGIVRPRLPEAVAEAQADEPFLAAEVVVAADGWGLVAALVYGVVRREDGPAEGVEIAGFEVELPPVAVPVRRGVTRVSPGVALRSPASIAIVNRGEGGLVAVGLGGGTSYGPAAASGPSSWHKLDLLSLATAVPIEPAVEALHAAVGASYGGLSIVLNEPRGARAVGRAADLRASELLREDADAEDEDDLE